MYFTSGKHTDTCLEFAIDFAIRTRGRYEEPVPKWPALNASHTPLTTLQTSHADTQAVSHSPNADLAPVSDTPDYAATRFAARLTARTRGAYARQVPDTGPNSETRRAADPPERRPKMRPQARPRRLFLRGGGSRPSARR